MINIKSLKIFLSILMLQVGMQVHADNDALTELVKGILGAKLMEGIAQEFNGENTNQQNYSSDNRVNTGFGNKGSLGYQYYLLGQKNCKKGEHQKALKWFKESKQQGYLRSVENVYKACSSMDVQSVKSSNIKSAFGKHTIIVHSGDTDFDGNPIRTIIYPGDTDFDGNPILVIKTEGDQDREIAQEGILNELKVNYINQNSQSDTESNKGSLGYQYYRIGKKHCKKGETQQAINWFKESKKQGYTWADRAIDNVYLKCRGGATYTSNQAEVCSNGVSATAYVDNECPSITNRWSNNDAKVNSNSKAVTSENITIKAPKYVENAAVVPVTVVFGDRVHSGDKVKLYVNGKLALQVNPKKGSYIDQISTRVILERKRSRIKAKIIRSSGVIETKTSNKIYADNSASIPSSSDNDKIHKLKEKDGNIKMLIRNKMGSGKHIWKIKLASSSGEVFVKLSPLLSKNPYFQIKGNHSNAKLVKTFYGSCNKDYSNSTKEPRCLLEQERWHASLDQGKQLTNVTQNSKSSFSDLWGQYGGSILDSNANSSSDISNSYDTSEADTRPPVIRFNHSDSMLVNDKKVTISGVIKDGSKITELLVKGKEVTIDENGNFSISRYVRLGRNAFDIVALDAFGNKATKVVTITRNKDIAKNLDKPLDLPSFTGRKDKDAVALIIGLDQYESIARAPWAESDASVFFDYAQQSLGIPADRIALITGNESDRSGIYDSLDMWLPTMVEKGDSNVYVYFAGHGLATADGEQAYLIPYDGNLENLRRTAIPRKEVISVLKDLKAKSVTLFMDTCYSGTPKGGKGTLVADSRGLRIVKKDNFSSLPKNFTIFSAASNQQTASSHPSLENGLFSYWMMRGLGGEADNNNDRKITNGELHKFINKNVKKAAALMGRKQNSQLVGDKNKVIASW